MAQQIFSPTIPSLQVGNRVFTDLQNLIILESYGTESGTTGISTMRKHGASAGYQVTAGKTLNIYAIRIDTLVYLAKGIIQLGYGDNDVGQAVNTTPTNAVARVQDIYPIFAVGTRSESDMKLAIPAQKYMYVTQGTTAIYTKVQVYGYES